MNELNLDFEGKHVRIIARDGVNLWVGPDVCAVLGYANPREAIAKHVRPKHRDAVTIRDAIGRDQETTVITEAGLYSLILRSKKPEAERFQDWVTEEVLPTLRRTGTYAVPGESPVAGTLTEARIAEVVRESIKAYAVAGLVDVSSSKLVPIRERIHQRCDRPSETDCRRIMGRIVHWAGHYNRQIVPRGMQDSAPWCVRQEDIWLVDKAIDEVWERHGINGLPLFRKPQTPNG